MSEYTYEKLYLQKKTFLSDNKSIDAAKQPRYAELYHEYSHKKLERKSENCLNGYNGIKKHKKRPSYNDLIIAYTSRYKARIKLE